MIQGLFKKNLFFFKFYFIFKLYITVLVLSLKLSTFLNTPVSPDIWRIIHYRNLFSDG